MKAEITLILIYTEGKSVPPLLSGTWRLLYVKNEEKVATEGKRGGMRGKKGD